MMMISVMPKHISVLYINVVLNILAFKLAVAYVNVIVQNETKVSYPDVQASFGPNVPSVGIRGYLIAVKPINGCQPVEHPPGNLTNQSWIALIERDDCSFRDKVHHAQRAGFAAVIVYNSDGREQIFQMGGDDVGILIPSVMVGWSNGILLKTKFCYECRSEKEEMNVRYEIMIDDKDHYEHFMPTLMWPFIVGLGTCLVVMLCFVFVKWVRDVRQKKKSRLTTNHLKKIPTKKFKKGDVYDACAICLDDYEEGDKLRLLPCSHAYHCACVDPWLTRNKKNCPVCKRKVIPHSADSDSDSSEDDNGNSSNTASERTPLLANAHTNVPTSGSTFDNSGLPEVVRTQVRHINEEVDRSDENTDSELAVTSQQGRTYHGEESYSSSVLSTSDEEDDVIEEVMYAEPNRVTHSVSNTTEDAKKTNHIV